MNARLRSLVNPAAVTLFVLLLYLGSVLVQSDFSPFAFVRIGSTFESEHSVDEAGYDGQFVYFIARNLQPDAVAPLLDVPAYRYQRILLPLLARLLAFGSDGALPWILAAAGLIAHFAGVLIVARLLEARGVSRWYALVYGLWAGFLLAARLDLPEPLAYALVAAALATRDYRPWLKWLFFSLAVFAKEIALLFVGAQIIVYLLRRDWRGVAGLTAVALLPYAAFQIWLRAVFGDFGIGSGGAMATSFEWVPFMGWFRIIPFSAAFFAAYGLILVPFFYLPAVWSIFRTITGTFKKAAPEAAYLLVHAAVIPFLPFSTVREPGGLLRFGCGFVLALLLFAAKNKEKKALRYSIAWLALSAVILNA